MVNTEIKIKFLGDIQEEGQERELLDLLSECFGGVVDIYLGAAPSIYFLTFERTENKIIGCVAMSLGGDDGEKAKDKQWAYFFNDCVHPSYRRKGIAQRMYEVRLRYCRRRGYLPAFFHIRVDPTPNIAALGTWVNAIRADKNRRGGSIDNILDNGFGGVPSLYLLDVYDVKGIPLKRKEYHRVYRVR